MNDRNTYGEQAIIQYLISGKLIFLTKYGEYESV